MSRDTHTDNLNQQAFEYVIGTLRGEDRKAFSDKLAIDAELAHQVHFWEEQLMALPQPPEIPPAPHTWQRIANDINLASDEASPEVITLWQRVQNWLAPGLLGSVCTLLIVLVLMQLKAPPASEYIAVLNDTQGRPTLTAITQGDTASMRIQWQPTPLADNKNLQLWAISKQDGQARSLTVFSAANGEQIQLDTAQLRLVKDADSLLLTEEDVGGSAIDEPSTAVVAKGVCVRFAGR